MHIAFIVTDLTPPRIGGISKVATETILHLLNFGHSIDVYCLKRTVDKFSYEHKNLQLIEVSSPFQIYKDYPVVSFSIHAFRKMIKKHYIKKYDICHAMNFNNYGMPWVKKRMACLGIKHISTAFETTEMEISAKWTEFKNKPTLHCLAQILMELYLAPFQKAYIGWADGVSTEDIETKGNLIKKGIRPDKIQLIPSGINLEEIDKIRNVYKKRDSDEIIFCCPGRVDTRKGTQYLIRAFANLVKQTQRKVMLKLVGGGRGDYIDSMRLLCKELAVEKKVVFTGKVESMYPYYCEADFIVIPSLSEGIPITLQEALAFEKPVVCSKLHGTYAYAGHLKSIFWSEPGNHLSLLNSMKKILERQLKNEIQEGRSFIEDYDWENVARSYESLYKSVLS